MKRIFALGLASLFAVALVGCGNTTKVKETKTVTTPGGSATTTTESKTTTSGENPPAAPKP